MQQKSIGSQIWRYAGPLVIQYLISLAVSTCISAVILAQRFPEIIAAAAKNADMTQLVNSVTTEVLKYTTEITTVAALVTIPIMLIMFRKDQKNAAVTVVQEKVKLSQYLFIVILGAGACIALNNLLTMGNLAFYSDSYQQVSEGFYSAKIIVQVIGLGFITPIAEELVFRGLIYKRLREHMTVTRSMVWSALVFGLYHGNLVQAIYGFILGFLLAYLYETYGSLKAPIFGHMVLNLCSILFTNVNLFDWIFDNPLRMGIVTVVSAAVAAAGFVFIQKIAAGKTMEMNEKTE